MVILLESLNLNFSQQHRKAVTHRGPDSRRAWQAQVQVAEDQNTLKRLNFEVLVKIEDGVQLEQFY